MESNIQHDQTKLQMNVSKEADAEFMRLLEKEEPERYAGLMKNMRRDNPTLRMSEDQALTNFMLGLPTGQYCFRVIAGPPAPEPISVNEKHAQTRKDRASLKKRIRQARAMRSKSSATYSISR